MGLYPRVRDVSGVAGATVAVCGSCGAVCGCLRPCEAWLEGLPRVAHFRRELPLRLPPSVYVPLSKRIS